MKRPFPAYTGPENYVFVCYSHEDKDLVYPEIIWLHETGYRIWYDEGIPPASEWSEALARAIDGCTIFLFFVTPRSVASEHCRREVNYALDRSCMTVTVHLAKADLPHGLKLALSNRQAILRYEYSQSAYQNKLQEALRGLKQDAGARSAVRSEFLIGEHLVQPNLNRIGDERIEPKAMKVLLALADSAPGPMPPEELLEHVWQNAVVVDNVVHKAVARLRRAFGDDAQHPTYIETVPRQGYRLIAQLGQPTENQTPTPNRISASSNAKPWTAAAALIVASLGLTVIALRYLGEDSPPGETQIGPLHVSNAQVPVQVGAGDNLSDLSVMVIPVVAATEELVSNAEQLTADLRGHFANYQELRTFDSANPESAFGAARVPSYRVEGVLGNSGELRVELSRKSDGRVVWSEEFRAANSASGHRSARPAVVASIVRNQLALDHECALVRSKARVGEAADAICTALAEFHYGWIGGNAIDPVLAMPRIQRAIDLEPTVADGYVRFAEAQLWSVFLNQAGGPLEAGQLAHTALNRALDLEPNNPMIYAVRAQIHAGIDLDYESAQRAAQTAIALGPLHPRAYHFQSILAEIAVRGGRLIDAMDHYRRSIQLNDSVATTYSEYARALNWADQPREALRITNTGLELANPGGVTRLLLLDQNWRAQEVLGHRDLVRQNMEVALAKVRPDSRFSVASLLARIGRADEARAHAEKLESMDHPSMGTMVYLYAYLGAKDRGFHWLHQAIDGRIAYVLVALRNDQNFNIFRADSRWNAVIEHLESEEAQGRERNRDRTAY